MKRFPICFTTILVGLLVHTLPVKARPAAPAVVNALFPSDQRGLIRLDGQWDFAVDPRNEGQTREWFKPGQTWPQMISIQVPGCWEAQGVGGPGNSTAVTYETSIRPLVGAYVGTAWYRKETTLPADWTGRRIWLKIGGVHAQGWFWINGTYVARAADYCGTYKYDITDLVRPGERMTVVAKVRNDVPAGTGLFGWIHRFGGLYRGVEIEATGDAWIDDAWVEPLLDEQKARLHINLSAVAGQSQAAYTLEAKVLSADEKIAGQNAKQFSLSNELPQEVVIDVQLDPLKPWSPEHPYLYKADVILKKDGEPIDDWRDRFGMRKWEVRGSRFYLNNQPYFLRGFGDDYIYPLTLCSPASREEHKKHLQLARDYGFNYVRHHTHCELPEFFEAADEVGIMVQPELPYYGRFPSEHHDGAFKPMEDLLELITHYRRYVSLSTYCMGNEGRMASPLDRELYQLGRRMDPTRLIMHQDGSYNTPENSDFDGGPWLPWPPGRTEVILKEQAVDVTRPFVCHEYLNLATDEDPRLADKYTGAIKPPVTVEAFKKNMLASGLSWEWGTACLDAGQQLQRIYQKRGLEQARLDAECDGYIFWTIVDVGSPSAQGLFNQFWEPKAASAEYFRQFNGPVALLAEFSPAERIVSAGQKLSVKWWISFFDECPLNDGTMQWELAADKQVLQSGTISGISAKPGEVKMIGETMVTAPMTTKAVKLELRAALGENKTANCWPVWVFPCLQGGPEAGKKMCASAEVLPVLSKRYPCMVAATTADASQADLMLTEKLDDEAIRWLEQGRNVFLLKLDGPRPGVELGWWSLGDQRGTAIAPHPAFGRFPHDGYLDEAFFRLVDRAVNLRDARYRSVEPLAVGHGREGYLAHVFQARMGKGKVLGVGFNLLSGQPEADYLLDEMILYVRSEAFQPKGVMKLP